MSKIVNVTTVLMSGVFIVGARFLSLAGPRRSLSPVVEALDTFTEEHLVDEG